MKQIHSSSLNNKIILWLDHHIASLKSSFKRILSNPLSFSFTIAMIAIALSIPISLYVFFSSVQQLTNEWDSDKQITLFLNDNVSLTKANSLVEEIINFNFVASANVINKQQALDEFNKRMGMGTLSSQLADNPLPHLIIIEPSDTVSDITHLESLKDQLNDLKQVQLVQFDLLWFQRLQAILEVISRIQWLVGSVLILAIALIIINVINWEVSARHSEIEIVKLVGATDAYVRRPFLYSGLWLGMIGSIIAIIIVTMSTWLIEIKTTQLSALFNAEFELASLSAGLCLLIILFLSFLGVTASWVAVTHRLKQYT